MKTKLILTGFAIMISSAIMSGQDCQRNANCNGKKCHGSGYVDANKNGVCDRYESRNATSDSTKTTSRQGKGKCQHYTDANKNGVCDNAEKKAAK